MRTHTSALDRSASPRPRKRTRLANALAAVFFFATACGSPTGQPVFDVPPERADDLLVVDCLLPGRVRQLGSQLTYMEPPRPAKVSAVECEIRGGEYTSFDRANFATSLKIWLPKAKEGDAQAQTYVGEIFEKGLGVTPDYKAAHEWYEKAAAQGHSPAQINLGQLYEKGLGVKADPLVAMNWYRKASGLEELQIAFVPAAEHTKQLEGLRSKVSKQTATVSALRKQLDTREKELADSRKQRNERTRAIEQEKKALASTRDEVAEERKRVREEQAKIAAEAKELAAERRRLERKLANARPEEEEDLIAAGQRHIEAAASVISSLYTALTSSESTLDARSSEIASRAQQTESESRREREAIAAERKKLAAERTALAAAAKKNSEESKRLDRERAELAAERERSQGSASQLAARKGELDRTASELATLATAHARRAQALEQREIDLDKRAEAQKELENERVALADARTALEAERKRLALDRKALQMESKRVDQGRRELAEKASSNATTAEKIAAARTQVQRMKALASLQAEVQKSQDEALAQRQKEIEAREAAYERKRNEVAQLDDQIAALRAEADAQRSDVVMLAQNNAVNLPGPSIQLIDPLIPLTRGLKITMAIPPASKRVLVGRVEAPAGLVSLTVNDREVKADRKGIFRTDVVLAEGDTPVTVVAIDRDGQRGTRDFVLESAPGVRSATPRTAVRKPKVDFGNYYALVIGNNAYTRLPRLETAIADATAMGRVLEERYDFEVTTLTDASRYQILSTLNTLRSKLTEDDNLLIYYAGHGELDKVNMRGHWLPVDAEPTSTANWISNIALTDILNTMNARHVMVVADSCYSGALTRSALARLEAGLNAEAREAWQRAMAQKRSRTALTSGGLAPVLDAGGGNHSIFARALIDILEANTGVLEGQRLFQELSAQVTWAAEAKNFEQVPQYAPIKFAGHESGDFFFVPES